MLQRGPKISSKVVRGPLFRGSKYIATALPVLRGIKGMQACSCMCAY